MARTTPRRKLLRREDLGDETLEAIRRERARRPTWKDGVVLACSRCRTVCVGERGCACCRTFKNRNPGGGLVYPGYSSYGKDEEPAHYAVCRVSEVA